MTHAFGSSTCVQIYSYLFRSWMINERPFIQMNNQCWLLAAFARCENKFKWIFVKNEIFLKSHGCLFTYWNTTLLYINYVQMYVFRLLQSMITHGLHTRKELTILVCSLDSLYCSARERIIAQCEKKLETWTQYKFQYHTALASRTRIACSSRIPLRETHADSDYEYIYTFGT